MNEILNIFGSDISLPLIFKNFVVIPRVVQSFSTSQHLKNFCYQNNTPFKRIFEYLGEATTLVFKTNSRLKVRKI